MKKTVMVLITLSIVFSGTVVASAASLNKYEQEVYNILATRFYHEGRTYGFPIEYLNQAENYFLQIDITKAQRDEMWGFLEKAKQTMIKNKEKIIYSNDTIDIRNWPEAEKDKLLLNSQKAGAVVGLKIIFNGTYLIGTKQVNGRTIIVFTDEPIIKVTGLENVSVIGDSIKSSLYLLLVLFILMLYFRKKYCIKSIDESQKNE